VTPDQVDGISKQTGARPEAINSWIAEAQLRASGKRITRPRKPEPCPQDLSRVPGIGSALSRSCIQPEWAPTGQLSQLADEQLGHILDCAESPEDRPGRDQGGGIATAEETKTQNRTWDGTPPDDFEPIEGLGPVYEGRLYDAGICTYPGTQQGHGRTTGRNLQCSGRAGPRLRRLDCPRRRCCLLSEGGRPCDSTDLPTGFGVLTGGT